jgi:uncharacterized membrane protein YoaK (UPF0700 family)
MTLALVLAAVAGAVDLICYFSLFHIFTAHMSGNTVTAAAGVETGHWNEAAFHALPIPCFIAGVGLGTVIGTLERRRGAAARFAPTLFLEACALAGFAMLARSLPAHSPAQLTPLLAMTLALPVMAMGLQNATLRRVGGKGVRTTFISGMLTDFAESATAALMRTGPIQPALVSGGIWFAYLAGAAFGGWLRLGFGAVAILAPAVTLVLLGASSLKPTVSGSPNS